MRFRPALLALMASALLSSVSLADSAGMIVKPSAFSVVETVERLEGVLLEKGATVFDRVDHAAGATKAEMELLPTQLVIFGNPKLGTPLMASERAIGIDLPLKALVWEDEEGKVWLGYNDPSFLVERHGIDDRAEVVETITGALDNFTNAATKAD